MVVLTETPDSLTTTSSDGKDEFEENFRKTWDIAFEEGRF